MAYNSCTPHATNPQSPSMNCFAKVTWPKNSQINKYPWKVPWQISLPLQVGGLAHSPPDRAGHHWSIPVVTKSFEGCITEIRINEKVSLSRQTKSLSIMPTQSCLIIHTQPIIFNQLLPANYV